MTTTDVLVIALFAFAIGYGWFLARLTDDHDEDDE